MENPVSEPVLTPVQVPEPKTKPSVIYLVLSFLILVFLASTAFLYYQNMQLKNMLVSYQAQPAVSPTPIAYQSPVPTTDPTASWKTYTSERAGFSLKYPVSLPIETSLCGGTCLEDLIFTPNPAAGGSSIAVVLTFKDPRIKTLDDYKNILIKNDSSIVNVKDANVGGDTAVSYKLSGGIPPLPIIEYVVVHNGYYYVIRLEDSDETNKDLAGNQKMFDQILSTFKFTK